MGAPEQPRIAASNQPAPTRVAAVAPTAQAAPPASEGFFSSLARKVGLGSADTEASTPPPPPAPTTKPKVEAKREPQSLRKPSKPQPSRRLKPSVTDNKPVRPRPRPRLPPVRDPMVAGAQPIVPTNSFDSRFGATQ